MTHAFGGLPVALEGRPCRVLIAIAPACRELRLETSFAVHCTAVPRSSSMYQVLHSQLAREHIERRLRPRKPEGIRRSARLISLEIRRSRREGHSE